MAVQDNIITAPVTMDDIHNTLGANSYDLGTLCKHENINKWSIHKPVIGYNKTFDNDFTQYEGRHPNSSSESSTPDDWYNGVNCFGLRKSIMGLAVSSASVGGQGNLIQDFSFGFYYSNTNVEDTSTYNKPSGGIAAPYRMSDFVGYCHEAKFPLTGVDLPYEAFNLVVLSSSTAGTFQASVCMRYQFDDIVKKTLTVNGYTINAGLLAVKSLFNCGVGGDSYLAVIVGAPTSSMSSATGKNTNRTKGLGVIAISSTQGGKSATKLGEYDSIMGSSEMTFAGTQTMGIIGGTAASPSDTQFYNGEQVYARAAIAKKDIGGTYWQFFFISPVQWFTIGSGGSGTTWLVPSSITLTVTIAYDSTNSRYIAYINSESDFNLVVSGIGTLSASNLLSFSPTGSGVTIDNMTSADYSKKYTDTGSHTITASGLSGWSSGATPASRRPNCVFKTSQSTVVLSASTAVTKSDTAYKYFNGTSDSITLPTGSNTVTAKITLS